MTYNCLIVDDEQLARNLLKGYVAKIPELHLVGECKNPLEARAILQQQTVHLLLLDIEMPDIRGTDFLRSLDRKPAVIFTTAYSEYALESYDLNAADYLVKPISFERFLKAIHKVLAHAWPQHQPKATADPATAYLVVHADHKLYKVPLVDIEYIEGLREYVSYFTKEKRIVALESLKNLEERLPADQFMRVHKSYIVPIAKIKTMEGNQLQIGTKMIPVGRSYRDIVLKKIFSQ
jgi:DNA-binding LytR/AlgR family response regulator